MGSDDAPHDAPADASHLTPEEKRGPRTLHVALLLLAVLLVVSVVSNPEMVLPRDSTLHGAHHTDEAAGLEIPVPVGWRADGPEAAEFGTTRMVPTGTGEALSVRILAGRMEPGNAAAAIADDQGAATALAEIVQQYVLGVTGTRDDVRIAPVESELGEGTAVSYVVVPTDGAEGSGGLVYAAVFGEGEERSWLAYLSTSQNSSPSPRWVDRLVGNIQRAG
ncbi:MAG TPA: hypothetical protein GX694_12310 [Actinomycetales bacterium]|nr:hypothetical protein [Actinomycetales bacterium]